MKRTFAALAVSLLTSAASAAEPRITGTYSNLRFGTEDLTGVEITLVYGGHAYYVLVQCAEGEPGSPELVPAHVDGLVLTFQLPASTQSECPTSPFRGIISSKGLSETSGDTEWPAFLRRGRSYWQ